MKQNVAVRSSKIGRGVFAGRNFSPGELILVIKGKKFKWGDPIHFTDSGDYLIQTGHKSYIMPDSPGIYLNHSCKPNAGIHKNRRLIAITEIKEGQEITFDYSTTMDENFWTLDCLCNEEGCRKYIQDFRLLPEELKKKYLILQIVQGFIAARYNEARKILK